MSLLILPRAPLIVGDRVVFSWPYELDDGDPPLGTLGVILSQCDDVALGPSFTVAWEGMPLNRETLWLADCLGRLDP